MLSIYTSITALMTVLGKRFEDKMKGATAVEYGIMVAGIAVLVIGAVFFLGNDVREMFEDIDLENGGNN